MKAWTIQESADLYNISGWSQDNFQISPAGDILVTPHGSGNGSAPKINLKRVVDDLVRRGLSLPFLIRFSDILQQRIRDLHDSFYKQIREQSYEGRYIPVMPIKVNQQRHVIEELIEYGQPYGLGLEAGSKPELLVCITLIGRQRGFIVCNGYKDKAYIELALLSQRLGITTLLIVDRFEELAMIIEASKRLGLKPNIGFRSKLSARGAGRWAGSGGDRSKFGLTAEEMVRGVDMLAHEGLLDRLVCLHFHIGSQITAIRSVKNALSEAVRIYVDLFRMGAPLGFLDVGGGLAVDYDGSKTNFHASRNYTTEEYAADIIDSVGSILKKENIPHPVLLSESGRALVAHHSVLVFNVLGTNEVTVSREDVDNSMDLTGQPQVVLDLADVLRHVTKKNYQEAYHDAMQLKEDALSLFRHGIIDLRTRARVEHLFWAVAHRIWKIMRELDYVPDELEALSKDLADIYFCNFSVFQSVPDHWAVDALFPVLPIHRLDERPTRVGILADLTCDSDGKVDKFIDLHDVKNALELHALKPNEPYFLGIFLVGAYQEVLGDLHNLFGDVSAVHIVADPSAQGGYQVKHIVPADKVKDVLSYVSYDQTAMMTQLRQSIEAALALGHMTFEESASLVRHFEAGFSGSTYLEEPTMAEVLLNAIVPQKRVREGDGGLTLVPASGDVGA